jgi:endoglucanase
LAEAPPDPDDGRWRGSGTASAGQEHAVVERLVADLTPFVGSVEVDRFGNVIGTNPGPDGAPSLMVAAHSDEIGGVVKAIEPDGMIRFERRGGVIETLLVGRAVRIRGHAGVVGVKAGHITPAGARPEPPPRRGREHDISVE